MDQSETYIKMCEKLPEEFDKYQIYFGDYYYDRHKKEVCIHFESGLMVTFGDRFVKFYRQDQLQDMVESTAVSLILRFSNWVRSEEGFYFCFEQAPIPNPSMEQLWLAFVMKEKYNKTWDGEGWVNVPM